MLDDRVAERIRPSASALISEDAAARRVHLGAELGERRAVREAEAAVHALVHAFDREAVQRERGRRRRCGGRRRGVSHRAQIPPTKRPGFRTLCGSSCALDPLHDPSGGARDHPTRGTSAFTASGAHSSTRMTAAAPRAMPRQSPRTAAGDPASRCSSRREERGGRCTPTPACADTRSRSPRSRARSARLLHHPGHLGRAARRGASPRPAPRTRPPPRSASRAHVRRRSGWAPRAAERTHERAQLVALPRRPARRARRTRRSSAAPTCGRRAPCGRVGVEQLQRVRDEVGGHHGARGGAGVLQPLEAHARRAARRRAAAAASRWRRRSTPSVPSEPTKSLGRS